MCTYIPAVIEFTNEPEDAFVDEGDDAIFNCSYSGTTALPFWFINGTFYSITSLPSNHSYQRQMLIVKHVQVSDSGTAYQCAFITIRSKIGTLYVIPMYEGNLYIALSR